MAQFTLNVPDSDVQRVVDAICARFGYTDSMGVTRQEFTRRQIAQLVAFYVRQYEADQARQQATDTVTDVPIT